MKNTRKTTICIVSIIIFCVGYLLQITGNVATVWSETIRNTDEYNIAYNYKDSWIVDILGASKDINENVESVETILKIGIILLTIGALFLITAIVLLFVLHIERIRNPHDASKKLAESDTLTSFENDDSPPSLYNVDCIENRSNYQCSVLETENPVCLNKTHNEYKGIINCLSGVYYGFKIPVCENEEVVIGSNPQLCNIVLNNDAEGISRIHCIIKLNLLESDYDYIVTDFSTNGTFYSDGCRLPSNRSIHIRRGEIIYLSSGINSFRME